MVVGWVSPLSLDLKSSNSPVGSMTLHEISLLASFPNYFAIAGAFVYAFIARKFGRKISLLCVGAPSIAGALVLAFATSKTQLYVGRVINGFSALCGINLAPMYLSETVHESIRGTLMSTWPFEVGLLMSYFFGKILSYFWFNCVVLSVPVLYTVLVFFLPETPYYLVTKSKQDEAYKSLLWLRGGDERVAKIELEKMQGREEETLSFVQTFKTRQTRLALVISVFAFFFQTLSGIHAVLNYSSLIFEEAGSPLSPDDSSILIAVLILSAAFVCTILVDKFGRKFWLYFSFFFCAVNLAVLSCYLYFSQRYDLQNLSWVPIMCVSLFVISYGLGLTVVPSVMTNEIAPVNIKPVVSSMVCSSAMVLVILVVQSFPFLDQHFGLYSCFAIPAVVNFFGLIYTWWIVPETKGKTLSEISDLLNGQPRGTGKCL